MQVRDPCLPRRDGTLYSGGLRPQTVPHCSNKLHETPGLVERGDVALADEEWVVHDPRETNACFHREVDAEELAVALGASEHRVADGERRHPLHVIEE